MKKELLVKIRLALSKGIITPYELSKLLHYRTANQLYQLMEAINYLYQQEEIVPIVEGEEKSLLLIKR